MKLHCFVAVGCLCVFAVAARAADSYQVASTGQSLPDEVAADVAKLMAPTAFKITSGKRTLCEVWLRKTLPVQADFTPTETVLYPFEVGQLIGVIRFPRKTTDFRNQEIAGGVYTLRYGLQPVDGNHVGTSETRDFLLLSPAAEDKDPAALEPEGLYKFSREASATTHPAILPMQSVSPDVDDDRAPSMVKDESGELWSVLIKGTIAAGTEDDQKETRLIQFVVVGRAAE
jgi:hypothetical protein